MQGHNQRTSARCHARAAALSLLLAGACAFQVVQTAPPMEPEPRTPEPLISMEDPKLEPTDVEGLFAAPALASSLFYYEPDERWYRYEYRRWYLAFSWDGNWFVPDKIPDALKAMVPEETPQTLKEQLKDLDKKLEALDREERLKQLEQQLEELDREDGKDGKDGKDKEP